MPSKGQAGVAESSSRLGTLHRQHKLEEACKVAKNRQSYRTYITQNTKHLRLDKISKEQTWRQKGKRKPESNPSSAVQTCGPLQATLSPSLSCRCGPFVCYRHGLARRGQGGPRASACRFLALQPYTKASSLPFHSSVLVNR